MSLNKLMNLIKHKEKIQAATSIYLAISIFGFVSHMTPIFYQVNFSTTEHVLFSMFFLINSLLFYSIWKMLDKINSSPIGLLGNSISEVDE